MATTSLPATEIGAPYAVHLRSSGGTGPFTWQLVYGALPNGLVLSSTGALTGDTVATGQYILYFGVTDALGNSASTELTLVVGLGPAMLTSSLPDATAGSAYAVTLAATGGTAPYTWSIPTGGIPPGLVLSSTGTLAGRPATPGSSEVALRVTDALGASASQTFAFVIEPAPVPYERLAVVTRGGILDVLTDLPTPALSATASDLAGVVSVIAVPDSSAYWLVTRSGHVVGIGTPSLGEVARRDLDGPIVAGAAHSASGYWLVSATGHVYGFGSARSLGSLKAPGVHIVSIIASSGGRGYWLISANGASYNFGAAPDLGAHPPAGVRTAGVRIVAGASTPDGAGYWLVSAIGTVFASGSAMFSGSVARVHRGTVVALAAAPVGEGYWVITRVGAIYAFGSAQAPQTLPAGAQIATATG